MTRNNKIAITVRAIYPVLSFICNSAKRKVWSYESTIGSQDTVGTEDTKGEFTISQITEEVVENELLEWLES